MDSQFEIWYNQLSSLEKKQLLKEIWANKVNPLKTDLTIHASIHRSSRVSIIEPTRIYTGPKPGKRICPYCKRTF